MDFLFIIFRQASDKFVRQYFINNKKYRYKLTTMENSLRDMQCSSIARKASPSSTIKAIEANGTDFQ